LRIMVKPEKISLIGLLILALFLGGFLLYNRGELMQPASEGELFRSDHVYKIIIVAHKDDWQLLQTNAMAKPYVRADFWFDGERYKNVAVRTKGLSSLMSSQGSTRLPLKVDFNFFNSAQSFRGIKKLSLNNNFSDPTFIREVLGYQIFEDMGVPTPRRAIADVWVNDTHLGLYTIVEVVDKTFLRNNFANGRGNLYKPDSQAANLKWTKADVDKSGAGQVQSSENKKQNNLDVKVGGARLGDLIKILKREGTVGSEMLPDESAASTARGLFPGPGGFGGRGPGGPGGQFPGEPNGPFGGRGGFPGGPGGRFPGEPNGADFEGGFPDGPPGQFFGGQDEPFGDGFEGDFPGGPGGQFPGEPNGPPGGRFRGRGGFGGGPMGGGPGGGPMGGRGGTLIEQMSLKTNENKPNHSALFEFLEVLNKCPDETFPAEIEKVLDVDECLKFLAVSALTVHLDNYLGRGPNYYLYEDNGKFCVIPWDLNMAFGTFGMGFGGGTSSADFYIDEPVSGNMSDKPLVARLLAHKPYLDKYHQYLEQLLKVPFAEGVIEKRVDELFAMVRPFVEADGNKSATEEFEKSLYNDANSSGTGTMRRGRRGGGPGGPGMNAPKLKSFIKERRLSVREQLDGKRPSRNQGGNQQGGFDMFNGFGGGFGGQD
jgi:spore coat protein CotH